MSATGATDATETQDADGLAAQAGQRMGRRRALPASCLGHAVVKANLPVPGEQQRHHVVADLVHAVIGHVGDGNTQFGRHVHGDVVHAHAVPAYDPTPVRRSHHRRRDLREAGHDAVAIDGQRGQRRLRPVRRLDDLHAVAQAGDKNFPLRRGGGPDEVGDEDAGSGGHGSRFKFSEG